MTRKPVTQVTQKFLRAPSHVALRDLARRLMAIRLPTLRRLASSYLSSLQALRPLTFRASRTLRRPAPLLPPRASHALRASRTPLASISAPLAILLISITPVQASADLGSVWDWLQRKAEEANRQAEKENREAQEALERAARRSVHPVEASFTVAGARGGEVARSCFEVTGAVPDDARTAVIYVSRRDSREEKESRFLKLRQQRFTHKVCLKEGPGVYSIRVWISTQESRPNVSVSLERSLGEVTVRNLDARPFDPYLFPSEEVQSDAPAIAELARSLTGGKSREHAVGALHDWVARHVAYDVDGYRAFLRGDESRSYRNKPLDALSVLEGRVAVCHGYSTLLTALLRAAGLRARVVEGWAIPEGGNVTMAEVLASPERDRWAHAWVEVELRPGVWRMMDVTWNSGYVSDGFTRFTPNPGRGIYLQSQEEAASHHLVTRIWDI